MKYVNIFIVLFFTQYIWSQTTIDVDADYIMVDKGQLTFLKEKDGNIHSKIEIRFYPVGLQYEKEIKTTSVEATAYDIKRFHNFVNAPDIFSNIIDVSSIKTQKIPKLMQKLEKGKFYNKRTPKYISQLSYYNTSLFIHANKFDAAPRKDSAEIWRSDDEKVINFVIVNLKNKKPIVIFPYIKANPTYDKQHRSDEKFLINYLGFIIPKKNKYAVKYSNKIFQYSTKAYPFLNGIISLQDPTIHWSHKFTFKDSQLKDPVFGQVLLDKKFDTISINSGFIFCLKDDKTTLYNLELENITPKGLQAAFPLLYEGSYAICLIDSTIKYVSKKGVVINELPKKQPISICGTDGIKRISYYIERDENTYVLSKRFSYYNVEDEYKIGTLKYPIIDKNRYQAMYFMNLPHQEKLPKSVVLAESEGFPEYVIVENNGKLGMFQIKFKSTVNQQNKAIVELKELLPTAYDVIKKVKSDHILISKNNLFGIYGLTQLKYSKLDVSKHFSRFTLPNGQKGWLDKLGREFLDE
ncbi:hypothetical protein [Kordia sp.]|uniref:hypothetical protein n=1 Tax=Kordia sp. TaxID=1965332 RepID=UPI003D6B38C4